MALIKINPPHMGVLLTGSCPPFFLLRGYPSGAKLVLGRGAATAIHGSRGTWPSMAIGFHSAAPSANRIDSWRSIVGHECRKRDISVGAMVRRALRKWADLQYIWNRHGGCYSVVRKSAPITEGGNDDEHR